MASPTRIRWSGIALLVAGALQAIGSVLHGDNADPNAIRSVLWLITQVVLLFFYAILAYGLVGLRALLGDRLGQLGRWGIALILVDTLPLLVVSVAFATLVPTIAAQQASPKTLLELLDPALGLGWLLGLTLSYLVLFVPGTVLLGIAVVGAGVLPRGAGLLIVAGILISFLGSGLPGLAVGRNIGGVIYALGLIWLGYTVQAADARADTAAAPDPEGTVRHG